MMTERLDYTHKALLYERLRLVNTQISEYSFSNLFLFRDAHHYEIMTEGDEVYIRGLTYDGHPYLMPTRQIQKEDLPQLTKLMEEVDFLFPVPESWLQFFSGDSFRFSQKKGEMDYVYTVERMSTYRGRDLHKKRNLLKQFISSYRHEDVPLTEERRGDAFFILEEWLKDSGQKPADTDFGPTAEALKLSEDLLLCGGIYYADGEPAGFILGEEVTPETFVVHFAKARKKFKGVYQYMFNSFAKILPGKYTFLNLEQDLEKEALRVAKSSYMPAYLVKKVRVSLRR